MITDGRGTPLAITVTGGNRHDVTQLLPLLDAIPHIRGRTGRPRHRPRQLFADRGHDFDKYRRLLWKRGIKPVIAHRGVPHGSGRSGQAEPSTGPGAAFQITDLHELPGTLQGSTAPEVGQVDFRRAGPTWWQGSGGVPAGMVARGGFGSRPRRSLGCQGGDGAKVCHR
ncbi:hypothetical protein GCM10010519_64220 [Streptomyces lactacystinicus]